jgi:heptosyltransferase-2
MSRHEGTPHVLVVHPGGLGDLVLVSELIASLKQAHPERALTLLCRAEFTAIVDGFPVPPDEVVGWPFEPYTYAEPTEELSAFLRSIQSQFAGGRVTVFVDAALRPNWLPEFLAAAFEPGTAIRCGLEVGRLGPLSALLERFGLSYASFRNLHLPAGTHERDRYRLLAEALESPFIRTLPWSLPNRWEPQVLEWLRRHGLERGRYLVCAPLGAASTPVKRWPKESFNEVLRRFFRHSQWPVLLMGDESERLSLTGLAASLPDVPVSLFAGRPEELTLAAGLLARAGAYLSNDSGLMHLAQAFEVPGAAIFGGGGEWPAYAPWARGSAGLCHPLPCFGCRWDCFLGHGLCVESIPVDKVYETLCEVCRVPERAPHNVILEILGEPLISLVADASARYREAERIGSERLEVIAEQDRSRRQWAIRERDLLARLSEAEARTEQMERAADEPLTIIEGIST